jgi:3-isopropylmalate/(R)-2-methylmalate dehydratase large subunit
MEFHGDTMAKLTMDDRFALCNLAIEAGAKTGIVPPDDVTADFMRQFPIKYQPMLPDKNAVYKENYTIDISNLEPQVAKPHLPSNSVPISQIGEVKVDQVVLGSCTNGRISDFKIALEAMNGKPVHPEVRLLVIPSTQKILLEMVKSGLAEIFIKAGAIISPPTCGPCIGGHMGVLAENEVGLFTTNRNFIGRNGHITSKVYLAGPAVAGATAVAGKITHPEEI